MSESDQKVMPKPVFYFLAFGFLISIFYSVLKIILPEGMVDGWLEKFPGWLIFILAIPVSAYLIIAVCSDFHGCIHRDNSSDDSDQD